MESPSEHHAPVASAIESVLIVDDDSFSRDWLSELLTEFGVSHIHTASDGRDALKQLRALEHFPDALICDVFMPNMDGIEVLQELIKRQFKGRFMLISGHDMQTLPLARELAEASLVNFAGAFVKPISNETLAQALKLA